MHCLDRAMAKGYEGVMFKSLETPYAPGSRDHDWQKLKPDYVTSMGDTLDLLIIAGYYGEGSRRGGAISHFLLGLEAPKSERAKWGVQTSTHLFYPFVKVGTGYSQQLLAHLREMLEPGQHLWHKAQRPAHLCGWVPSKTDDEPDVWFEPSQSRIMSVRAYEIVEVGGRTPRAYMPTGPHPLIPPHPYATRGRATRSSRRA